MIGAKLFASLLMAGGFVVNGTVHGRKGTYWTTGASRFGINGAQHDPERVASAEAKREMRRAKVARAVAAGGYGPNPYVKKAG